MQSRVVISLSFCGQDRAPGIWHLLRGTSIAPSEKEWAGSLPGGDHGALSLKVRPGFSALCSAVTSERGVFLPVSPSVLKPRSMAGTPK